MSRLQLPSDVKTMKAACAECHRDYDETEWMQFTAYLSPADREAYFQNQLCPSCYRLENQIPQSLDPSVTVVSIEPN